MGVGEHRAELRGLRMADGLGEIGVVDEFFEEVAMGLQEGDVVCGDLEDCGVRVVGVEVGVNRRGGFGVGGDIHGGELVLDDRGALEGFVAWCGIGRCVWGEIGHVVLWWDVGKQELRGLVARVKLS